MSASPQAIDARERGPGTALRRVEAALEAHGSTRRGKFWACVAHDDRTPSLSVDPGQGCALVKCRAGCSTDAVVAALGITLADLFDEQRQPGRPNGKAHSEQRSADEPQRERDAASERLPRVEDLGPPTEAEITWMRADRRISMRETLEKVGARHVRVWGEEWLGFQNLNGGWKLWRCDFRGDLLRRNVGPVSIFASPDLHTRNGEGIERLWDLEGESDALAAIDAGMLAIVAHTGGAGNLRGYELHRDRLRSLEPAEVVVVRDLDNAGRKGAAKAAAWWHALGVRVRVLDLPTELGEGGDARDYLRGRIESADRPALEPLGGPADLDALADAAPIFAPTPESDDAAPGEPPIESVSFSGARLLALLSREAPLPIEAARPVPGHFATLIAPPMVGKTTLALWNGMARAAGVAPWPGVEPRPPGRVLFYSIDEAPEQVVRRMHGLSILHPAGRLDGYAERLVVAGPDRDLDPGAIESLRFDESGLATLERWLSEAEAAGQPFVELYVDAYADIIPIGESENDNGEATRIGGALERLAVRHGVAIVLLHHCGKPKADAGEELPDVRFMGRGASALAAKARAVTSLELVGGMPHLRRVRTATNLGRTPKPQLFEVCSPETAAEEILFFKPAADATSRKPEEILSPDEEINTTELARRLAGKALNDDAQIPGDLKRLATVLRESWRAAGKVIVTDGPNRAKLVKLSPKGGDNAPD